MRRTGFTLIELLVVIAIIAVLVAISLPSMRRAKEQAQAVVCTSNLRQWGLCYQLYTQDYDGQFPIFIWNDMEDCTYMENYRGYYSDIDRLRFCPVAKKFVAGLNPINANRELGTTLSAWWINPQAATWMNQDDFGLASYGENSWIRSGTELNQKKLWRKIECIRNTSQVPMIGDARWCNAISDDSHPLPVPVQTEQQYYYAGIWRNAECFAMRRHRDGSNLAFSDSSVRQVPAEEIWSLKWNAIYEKRTNVDLSWLDF